ncbi:MAG: cell surface protein SprA, partial [Bacteroidales bacterium]|nr:cell surface protein SprA [Bacteroidales bacterium]
MNKNGIITLILLLATLVAANAIVRGVEQRAMEPSAMPAPQDTFPKRKVKVTLPERMADLQTHTSDLRTPENLNEEVEYDPKTNTYKLGVRMGDTYLNTPFLMTPEEYQAWSASRAINSYFRVKNDSSFANKGKEEFRFTDMKFNLGPAEKIFGPGGVRVRTQGSVELKLGANMQSIDNPSLPINRRSTFGFDFDEKINLNLTGSVGDKMNMNLNYNTEATFDFDTRNIKLRYEGKEDEIIKLVEAGNVSLPTQSSLIRGASSLFGVRTDMQFGRLKLQAVASQKKATSKTVNSRGGMNIQSFEFSADEYEQNRHFFLARFFRDRYDAAMAQLPNITSGVEIGRIDVWVTNNTGATTNTRNIVGLVDLAEGVHISNSRWVGTGIVAPSNMANTLYNTLTTDYADARNIDQTTAVLDAIAGFHGGIDYEKMASARKLSSSEFVLNKALGYISLRTALRSDQVLAVAFEYTYRGQTYQVGEFATDETNASSALFVKALKNTSPAPTMPTWPLMMKNVYSLGAQNIQKEKFRLDVKYLSDTTGVYLNYYNEPTLKGTPIIRLLGMDQLDANNNRHSDGVYDYVEGYTIDGSTGRIIFNTIEPFGATVARKVGAALAERYAFKSLYDSLRTTAQQDAEHNKYKIVGQYRGSSANEIMLGATNIPRGSVVVTAGAVTLTENTDYSVDYNIGVVTIINQSLLDAGTPISVSLESEADYSLQRKTLLGLNWEYLLHRDLTLGGTFMHLSEQALTSKVAMGNEAINNTLWGVNLSWKKKSQWLTNLVDKLPMVAASAPSQISLTAEYAQLIAGQNTGMQGNDSYLDDFENTNTKLSVSTPTEWVLSSTPRMFPESELSGDVRYGYNRALLSWYYIDPILTRRNSSLTPGHLRGDLAQQSNHYVREVYKRELFPNTQTTYGEPPTLSVLNLAYYPSQRGAYNLDTDLLPSGQLNNPTQRWGGMMRKLETTDFESSNIEYVEFWMLDPFIYTRDSVGNYGGELYLNLGDMSEDVLKDGQKVSESDMPLNEDKSLLQQTTWGYAPLQRAPTYAFNTASNSRKYQDVGYNGLRSVEEGVHPTYARYLSQIRSVLTPSAYEQIARDPAADDYHYFRGSDYDAAQLSILDRYKRINLPEGNSVDSENSPERYSTSYKDRPDVEDINSDYTLNEYDQYYQYKVIIHPDSLVVGKNFIVDSRLTSVTLRNNQREEVTWYLFRIPVEHYERRVGNIRDLSSIRFMRMFLTGFERPIILRLATLDLVRGEWRTYSKSLSHSATATQGSLVASSVSYEENSGKTPVNYVLPPGISRVVDPSQRQLMEENESALSMVVQGLNSNEARAVYKKTNLDLRNYKRLKMFTHINALPEQAPVMDNQVSMFVRLGSDYTNNYYEYEIPLTVTPAGQYSDQSLAARQAVWPEANNLDIPLTLFTAVKKERNRNRSVGTASYVQPFSLYDPEAPNNKVTVMGNPTLGEVRTMMIGVRNNAAHSVDAEVWVNEMRLDEQTNQGGWAAQGTLNVQVSDIGAVNATGRYETAGFGGIEEGIATRRQEDFWRYSISTNFDLGRFIPALLKLQAPIYYAYSRERVSPLYNPLDTDMKLKDALSALRDDRERDSLRSIAQINRTTSNFSISNARFNVASKRASMPYDPTNFTWG